MVTINAFSIGMHSEVSMNKKQCNKAANLYVIENMHKLVSDFQKFGYNHWYVNSFGIKTKIEFNKTLLSIQDTIRRLKRVLE